MFNVTKLTFRMSLLIIKCCISNVTNCIQVIVLENCNNVSKLYCFCHKYDTQFDNLFENNLTLLAVLRCP